MQACTRVFILITAQHSFTDHTILLLDPGNLRLGRREGGRQASLKPQAGQPPQSSLLTLLQSITEMDKTLSWFQPYSCPYMGWAEHRKQCLGKQERAHLGGCPLSKHLFRCLQSADIMDPAITAAEMSSAEDGFIL